MNPLEILRLSFTSLKANKVRTALTMLGVIIGVASVILLISIGDGVRLQISKEIELLGSNQFWVLPGNYEESAGPPGTGVINKLRYRHLELIRNRNTYGLTVSAELQSQYPIEYRNLSRKGAFITGAPSNYSEVVRWYPELGRFFNEREINSARRVAVIGTTVAKEFFRNLDPIGKKISIKEQSFEVIGVMSGKGRILNMDIDDSAVIPLTTAQNLFDTREVTDIIMVIPDVNKIQAAMAQVRKILLTQLTEDDFSVVSQSELLKTFLNFSRIFTAMLGGIAAISLLVGGIGIMNIMLVSVRERTREIGIRKAIGARENAILVQFLFESIVISMAGGAAGIMIGGLFSYLIGKSGVVPSRLTFWSVMLAFGFSAAVGIFFGVYPARKAAKLDPVDALRYE